MSVRQNYWQLKVVESCLELCVPSQPIGDDPAPIPLYSNKFQQ